jgi:hypothetical protein
MAAAGTVTILKPKQVLGVVLGGDNPMFRGYET